MMEAVMSAIPRALLDEKELREEIIRLQSEIAARLKLEDELRLGMHLAVLCARPENAAQGGHAFTPGCANCPYALGEIRGT